MIDTIFEFIEATPIMVMVRAIMERIFEPTALDELFESHGVKQYTRELLFSNVVSLMSLVVSEIHPSVSAAYRALESVHRTYNSFLLTVILNSYKIVAHNNSRINTRQSG